MIHQSTHTFQLSRSRGIAGLLGSKLFLSVIDSVGVGETFTFILIAANVVDLAGWQFNIAFNPAVLKVTSVNEGDFLSEDGGNTFFQEGDINNAAGTITGISGAFIGTGGVSGTGTLLSINFEAKAAGEGSLHLSAGKLGASQRKPDPLRNCQPSGHRGGYHGTDL